MNAERRSFSVSLCLICIVLLVGCSSDAPCGGVECTETTYIYLVEGDCELMADVYAPPGDNPTPVILWIHPGGMITGSRDWLDSNQLALYLEAGYTVVAIDHRLAPENKLETIVSDVEAAYYWVLNEGPLLFNIDPRQVAIVGHSAGGYLTLLTGFRTEPRPKALISFYGYGDLTGDWAIEPSASYNEGETITRQAAEQALESSRRACVPTSSELEGRFDYYVFSRQQGNWPLEISGHDPVAETEWFREFEPLRNLTFEYPPTMLLHGLADTDVPFAATERMVAALEENSVPYVFVSHASWNHVFDQTEAESASVQEALERVIEFLDLYVKEANS
jgi:acetyl esterase/lipase